MKKKETTQKEGESSKYLILGSIFILSVFILIIYLLSKTYALDGFGEITITCDKNVIASNEIATCTIKGTVSSTSQVSSLEMQTNLSSNLEMVSFTKDSSWEGEGTDGKIELYTDTNKSGTFNIGTIQIRTKSNIYNRKESIGFKDIVFYQGVENNWEAQSITDKSIEISAPTFTSTTYDLSKNYIITDSNNIATIISGITSSDCTTTVSVDGSLKTTGTIKEGSQLVVKYGNTVLKQYDLIYITSTNYQITNNTQYIITTTSDISSVANTFTVLNGTISVKNKKLTLSYNNTDIKTYDIIQLYSSKNIINVANNYVVATAESSVISNITKSDNITLSISNGNLLVTYGEVVIRTLKIYTISSSNYSISIEDKYIYTKQSVTDSVLKSNVTTNGTISLSNNTAVLKDSSNNTLVSFKVIYISSTNYRIDPTNKTVYTGNITDTNTINNNITAENSTITISNNTITISLNNKTIDEYTLSNISSSEYLFNNKTINIDAETDYQTFINNLTINNLTYIILDKNNTEITSGTIKDNYKIKLLINDTEVDTYTIILEYIRLSDNLNVKQDTKIIHKIKEASLFTSIIGEIDTNAQITIKDKDNREMQTSEKIKTGDLIIVQLNSGNVTYKASVLGDTTGDGEIKINDVGRLYSKLRGRIESFD